VRKYIGIVAFDFTPEHRDVAIRAFSELKELPLDTLVDAAKSYREHFDPERAQRTVNQIGDWGRVDCR